MIRVILGEEVKRQGRWRWTIEGTPLSGLSHQPLLDACREIKRMGGVMQDRQIGLYRAGKDVPDMVCGLDWGATHSVSENPSPHFVKWEPSPYAKTPGV